MSRPAGSGADDATAGVFDGKRVNGRKRFIVTDTLGLLVTVWVLAASWQDRDGAKGALLAAVAATPIRHVFADQGFAGRLVGWAAAMLNLTWTSSGNPLIRRDSPSTPGGGWLGGVWAG
ncbi:transposase [Micromonospora sp. NPDC005173]|uniref:transposase n=1 Tax=Micromonospora sp. NPDC005173 TaxID=3157165 RepID=UPI0033ABDEC9